MENKEQDYTLDQIIEQSFDFSPYSESEKAEMIAETSGIIMETSLLRALDESGEKVQEKFNIFIETEPDEDAMTAFINEHLVNFSDIVLDEIKNFQALGLDTDTETE